MKYYMPEMNRDEVKEAVQKKSLLLLPIATMEQHGPHAPLHTDMDNVFAVVKKVSENINPEPRVLCTAPVWFSPSPFPARDYPGCIMVRKDIYMGMLNDIVESYIRGGFEKIVLINGHGGGTERLIPQVIERINNERRSLLWPDWTIPAKIRVAGFSWFSFLGEFARDELSLIRRNPAGSDWHGGDVETSLQLYLRPDLVDMKKAKKGSQRITGKGFAPGDLLLNFNRQFIIDGYYPQREPGEAEGVDGDPTLASRELGEKIFDLLVKKISEFIIEFGKL